MPGPSVHLSSYASMAAQIGQRLASARATCDPLAPFAEEVIVASGGVAQAIGAGVVEHIPAGVAGMRLHTIETLALRILNDAGEYPRPASDAERRLAMRTAARSVDDAMTETRGAAAMLERSYRDVRDAAMTLPEFAARLKKTVSLRNRARLTVVVRVWEEYERLIARLAAVDPADILSRASAKIRGGAAIPPQVLAGFYDLTGAQWAFLRTLRDVEKLASVFIPSDAPFALPLIQKFGIAEPDEPVLPIRKLQWTITDYRTREEEIRGICESVGRLLAASVPAERIGITSRAIDAYDVHLFERFSAEFGFSVTRGAGMPLTAHRFGRALILLLRLREHDFPRAEVLEIARSGLRLKTKIQIDKADAETRRAMIAGGRSGPIRDRAGTSFILGDYASLVEELEQLTERIDAAFVTRLAAQFRMEDATDQQAVDEIEAIADLFRRAERWNRSFDTTALIDAIGEVTLPFAVRRSPLEVWLGDVMQLRGRTFDHLFAVRMQDDLLPQRRTEDPILPDSDRRQLDLREIGNGRDEEHLLFSLMRGASESHFSFASSDGFGKPLRASHLLKTFAIEQEPAAKPAILKNFTRFAAKWRTGSPACPDRRDRLSSVAARPRPLQLLARAGTRSAFDGYIASPLVRERAAAALSSISPTQLEDFGECPQKFLFKHILGVVDIDDPEREVQINHREKGSIDHRILERFYRSLGAEEIQAAAAELPKLPAELRERLEQSVDDEFNALEERVPPFNRAMRSIERRATKRVLHDFVVADIAELIAEGLTPAHFEYRFGAKHKRHVPDHPEPFVIRLDGEEASLRVEGTIDRIDIGAGRYRIVDYKSGKAGRHLNLGPKVDRGVRLQLALYAMAVADFFGTPPSTITAAIKPIARSDAKPEDFAFALGEKELRLRETLAIFARAISSGTFPAFPNESDRDFQSCKYCPVNHSCRTRHDAEEQRTALQWDEPRSMLENGA